MPQITDATIELLEATLNTFNTPIVITHGNKVIFSNNAMVNLIKDNPSKMETLISKNNCVFNKQKYNIHKKNLNYEKDYYVYEFICDDNQVKRLQSCAISLEKALLQ